MGPAPVATLRSRRSTAPPVRFRRRPDECIPERRARKGLATTDFRAYYYRWAEWLEGSKLAKLGLRYIIFNEDFLDGMCREVWRRKPTCARTRVRGGSLRDLYCPNAESCPLGGTSLACT